MTRMLCLVAACLAALGFAAAPAAAQPVSVTGAKPTANVRVLKPLQLAALRNLDFGTIVMGTLTATETISVSAAGRTCGTSGNLTCSGLFSTAQYRVNGSANQLVVVSATSPTYVLTSTTGGSLTLTPSFPATVRVDNSGNPGALFEVGGSLSIGPATVDGIYSGTIDIQVAYQ